MAPFAAARGEDATMTRRLLPALLFLAALLGLACSGGDGGGARNDAQARPTSAGVYRVSGGTPTPAAKSTPTREAVPPSSDPDVDPPPAPPAPPASAPATAAGNPSEVLAISRQRSTEVRTFRGAFDARFGTGSFMFEMNGDYAFEAPNKMDMTLEIFGERVEMLILLPEIYINYPGQGWFYVSADSVGYNKEEFERFVQERGLLDYTSIIDYLSNLQQLPDEAIDGVSYLHYQGEMNFERLLAELGDEFLDASAAVDSSFFGPLMTDIWLDKETFLPRRADLNFQFLVEEDSSTFTMDISMTFSDYNAPVSIPPAPTDARPIEELG
jgi:hypothetical protein